MQRQRNAAVDKVVSADKGEEKKETLMDLNSAKLLWLVTKICSTNISDISPLNFFHGWVQVNETI